MTITNRKRELAETVAVLLMAVALAAESAEPPRFDVGLRPVGEIRSQDARANGLVRWTVAADARDVLDATSLLPGLGIGRVRLTLRREQGGLDAVAKSAECARSVGMVPGLEIECPWKTSDLRDQRHLLSEALSGFARRINEWSVRIRPLPADGETADRAVAAALDFARAIAVANPSARLTLDAAANPAERECGLIAEALKRQGGERTFFYFALGAAQPNPDRREQAMLARQAVRRHLPDIHFSHVGKVAPAACVTGDDAFLRLDWTEHRQAKWLSRWAIDGAAYETRTDIPVFADTAGRPVGLVHRWNGQLFPRAAYWAIRTAASLFAGDWRRQPDLEKLTRIDDRWGWSRRFVFKDGNRTRVAFWRTGGRLFPSDVDEKFEFDLTVPLEPLKDPVWVDVVSGRVYAIPPERVVRGEGATTYLRTVIYDSPAMIGARADFDIVETDWAKASCRAIEEKKRAAGEANFGKMETRWAEDARECKGWAGYPRPQLKRTGWSNLNGLWDYAITRSDDPKPTAWTGKIRVPYPLESALSGVDRRLLEPTEKLWYRRTFASTPRQDGRLLLHFGAVDQRTEVYVNGVQATDTPHDGGNLPFTVDVTPFVRPGENELVVGVWDPTDLQLDGAGNGAVGKQALASYDCFYRRASGIWQTVWLEVTPRVYIESACATADLGAGAVDFRFVIGGGLRTDPIDVVVMADGREIASGRCVDGDDCRIVLPQPVRTWSPRSPYLYSYRATCGNDSVEGYFGMREVGWRRDAKGVPRLTLNGEFIYMHGALDQGLWPDGILTPPSEAALRSDVDFLQAAGFNTMRKHIKVEPAQFYRYCDEKGMLVWQDAVTGYGGGRDRTFFCTVRYGDYRRELKGMVDALRPFPCIVAWVPFNEGWGQPGKGPTNDTLEWLKRYDPSRLVDGPSGWFDYGVGDMRDRHHYPEPVMEPVSNLVDRVSVLGEYGSVQYALPGHVWKPIIASRKGGCADASEALARYAELMDGTCHLVRQGLSASIYTMTTDSENGVGGLLTHDRLEKFPVQELRKINFKLYETYKEAIR